MAEVISVNFSKPMPLFPLPEVVLLPHAIQPLHVFEDRYRVMVEHCLDGSGQIAMASFDGDDWKKDYEEGLPKLRPAVCIGQIVHHESLPDGRHQILLHGVLPMLLDRASLAFGQMVQPFILVFAALLPNPIHQQHLDGDLRNAPGDASGCLTGLVRRGDRGGREDDCGRGGARRSDPAIHIQLSVTG